jgi:hypothetical protein
LGDIFTNLPVNPVHNEKRLILLHAIVFEETNLLQQLVSFEALLEKGESNARPTLSPLGPFKMLFSPSLRHGERS